MKDLTKIMENKDVKAVLGLEVQGHIPTIKRILDKWNEPVI